MDFDTVPDYGPELGTFRKECRVFVLNRDNWTCHYCDTQLDREGEGDINSPTVDHMVPTSKGGTWAASNLVACCSWCNTEKDTLDYDVFVNQAPWRHGRQPKPPYSKYVSRGRKILAKIEKGVYCMSFDDWLLSVPEKYQPVVKAEVLYGN
jgi:hypothetical protein